jgi:hypothetical protein
MSTPNRIINDGMITLTASPLPEGIDEILAQGWTIVRVPFTAWGAESQAYVLSLGIKQDWLKSHGLVKGVDYRIIESQRIGNGFRDFTVTYCWLFQNPQWAAWFSLRWT